MPQVTFHPLPIPEGVEGLQDENEDKCHEQLTINILNDEEGWTIVRHEKKKTQQTKTNKSDKWNKQQKINFERYGDIWDDPLSKSYQICDGQPIANLPLQQQVQQPQQAQQLQPLPAPQVQPPPAPPLPLQPPALPVLTPLLPALLPLVCPPQIRKRNLPPPDLPPIQEEDEDQLGPKLQRLYPRGCQVPQEHQRFDLAQQCHPEPQHPKVGPDKPTGAGADQELGVAFEKLAISPPST
jgi:hypothetical protein